MPTVFQKKVYSVAKRIHPGQTMTYKQVAGAAGNPRAYRAVGNALNKNYDPKIPCHRVIKADGEIGGYNRGKRQKKMLLNKEKNK